MKKRRLSPQGAWLIVIAIMMIIAVVLGIANVKKQNREAQEAAAEMTPEPTVLPTPTPAPEPTVDPSAFSDPDSLLLLANKKHRLPEGYAPDDLVEPDIIKTNGSAPMRKEAAEAVGEMVKEAAKDGVTLKISSAYRSEDYQSALYSGYSQQYGSDVADTISSRPGYSDHQTGLAADFVQGDGSMDGINFEASFEDSDEGKWLAAHAREFGFIMRYPKGKDAITGYTYEPWHFRYVGKDWARKIYETDPDETFEEYFNVSGGDYEESKAD